MTRPKLVVVAQHGEWPSTWTLDCFDTVVVDGTQPLPTGVDAVVLVHGGPVIRERLAGLVSEAKSQSGVTVLLAEAAQVLGAGNVLTEHALDGFLDLRWPNLVAQSCLHIAIRHVQLGRKAAELQRAVIVHTKGEAARMRDLATRDELTQLFNGRHFSEVMRSQQDLSRRHHGPYALMYMDLDGLKVLNATFGHAGGSKAITEVAALLQARMRTTDMAVRLGGDEFVAYLPECDLPRAVRVAEGLCQRLREHVFEVLPGHTISVTASIGVAGYPEHGKDYVEVLKHADDALLMAKRLGKNRVMVHAPDLAPVVQGQVS